MRASKKSPKEPEIRYRVIPVLKAFIAEMRWFFVADMYFRTRAVPDIGIPGDYLLGPALHAFLGIDADRSPMLAQTILPVPKDSLTPDAEKMYSSFSAYLAVPLMALTFLNCKNVHISEPLARDEKFEKAYRRRHGCDLIRYRVIDNEPFRKILDHGTGRKPGAAADLRKAMHFVRGHFKTYTPAKPLFGSATGTYFFAQHIRGNAEKGLVIQSLKVKAPHEEEERQTEGEKG